MHPSSYIKVQCKTSFCTLWLSSSYQKAKFIKSHQNLNFNTQFQIYEQGNQIPGHQFQKVDFYFVAKFIVLKNTNFTKPQQNLNFKMQLPIFEQNNQNPDHQFHKFNISHQTLDYNAKTKNQKIKN